MDSVTNKTRITEKQKKQIRKILIRKQNESNKEKKQNERKQKRENTVDQDVDIGRFFELATINKIYVNGSKLHEIKYEILVDYSGDFEMIGRLKVGGHIRDRFTSRFKNIDDYEAFINSIDYDSEDVIFHGYIYKFDTPQFNKANRSQFGNGCDLKHQIIEYHGNNCYIPSNGYCFIKCINFITKSDYKEQYLEFFRNEQRRSNIMTKARIQPFCRANIINLGYFAGERVYPRLVTQRDTALYLFNNHFCLIWKSEHISFDKAIKELKDNFKIVDNYLIEENVKSHFEYVYQPKKIESHLTNF